ncbi:conserved hypothetical protein [Xanthomonas citri pv. citri]|nr:conserved hypothetical protein [Xanthomonas citri pv. citri]
MASRRSGLQRQDPAPQRDGDRMGAIAHAELAQDVLHMCLDGFFGDAQGTADLLVGAAGSDQVQHFGLAGGQGIIEHMGGDIFGHRGRHMPALAAAHVADGVDQLTAQRALEQVTAGACLEGAYRAHVAGVGGQHDDLGGGVDLADALDGFDPVHARHLQIHQHHVRAQARVAGHRLFAVFRFADHAHVVLGGEHGTEPIAQQRMVVYHQHVGWSDHVSHWKSPWIVRCEMATTIAWRAGRRHARAG